MAQLWLHLCICLQIPGFCTNLLLSQTPEHILSQTNSKTEILCELKKEYAGVYWYRWSQEKQNFEFLIFSNLLGKATYGADIRQDKFSVHVASSHTSYRLHISHLHASDNGTYYCSVFHSSQLLLGSGTQLSVADFLPLPLPLTLPPKTTPASVSKSKTASKKEDLPCFSPLLTSPVIPQSCRGRMMLGAEQGTCSPLVWVPLAASILVLLLTLVPTAYRLHRLKRRLWLRIHRQ
ncbi:T-cell surface glycoprotein CD8 beta chain [Rhynochetos jubatus]